MPLPKRKVLRARGYDYSAPSGYFITVVAQARECLFSEIREDHVVLNEIGRAIEAAWCVLPERFPALTCDEFVVMPNHLHGILILNDVGAPTSLSTVLQAFKSLSTLEVNRRFGRHGTLWQRGFYDHIIRDEKDLFRVREYISLNPLKWALDEENPDVRSSS